MSVESRGLVCLYPQRDSRELVAVLPTLGPASFRSFSDGGVSCRTVPVRCYTHCACVPRFSWAHVASGPGAEDAEAPVVLEYSTTDTVLDLLKKHSAYMRTLVLRAGPMSVAMEKTLRAFEFQCLYGALNGPPLPLLPLVNH